MPMTVDCRVRVNGTEYEASVPANKLLVDWLREDLGLRGTRVSCDAGACGVCTVLVDGMPGASCSTFVYEVEGCSVETIEGLAEADGGMHAVQQAFLDEFGFQCGFCTPGMILVAVALLRRHPLPTSEQIRDWLSSNVCRCTGYQSIVRSVRAAAESLAEHADEESSDAGLR